MKIKLLVLSVVLLSGCGGSRKQALRDLDGLLEKSKYADCETIRKYLDSAHNIVHAEAYK